MNETTATATSNSGASLLPSETGTITVVFFVLMLLIAIAAVAMIVAGIRRKRMRSHAAREVDRHAEQAGVPLAEPETAPEPTPAPPTDRAAPAAATSPPPPPPPIADEPIAAAAPLDANPATLAAEEPAAPTTAAAPTPADGPVTLLKGLGPKVAARLAELGITTVGQIAALDDEQADAIDARLGTFSGRMGRDRWVEQARFLAAGDRAGFEAVFGRL